MIRHLIHLFALLLFFNTGLKAQNSGNPVKNKCATLYREWMLTEFKSWKRDSLIKYGCRINIKPDACSAFAGCNQLFFKVKNCSSKKLSFTEIAATEMYCDGKMQMEAQLSKALSMVTGYKVSGHQIIFFLKNKSVIRAVAADWD